MISIVRGLFTTKYNKNKNTVTLTQLNPDSSKLLTREEHKSRLKESSLANPFDVVIIGGGCNGAAIALDCSSRGLTCCLLEANDFGGATSMGSTKLLHGGLRYLHCAIKQLNVHQFKNVVRGIQERGFLRYAGGNLLTYNIALLYPLNYKINTRHDLNILTTLKNRISAISRASVLNIYDILGNVVGPTKASKNLIPKSSKIVSHKFAASTLVSAIRPDSGVFNKGRGLYFKLIHDGAHFDHRSTLHILQTAAQPDYCNGFQPAIICNYMPVVRSDRDVLGHKVQSVTVVDKIANEEIKVFGKSFVNATGPFSDNLLRCLKGQAESATLDQRLVTSAGIHLSLSPRLLGSINRSTGIIIPKTNNGSMCFLIPYRSVIIAGTTERLAAPSDKPCVTDDEVHSLCQTLSEGLGIPASEVTDGILSYWKAFRPLIKPKRKGYYSNAKAHMISRAHQIIAEDTNLYSILGGKWTTCRYIAEECVNVIMRRSGTKDYPSTFRMPWNYPKTKTRMLPWSASVPPTSDRLPHRLSPCESVNEATILERQYGLSSDIVLRLLHNYGYFTRNILEEGEKLGRNKPISTSVYLLSELDWILEKEYVSTVDDVICRRLGAPIIGVEHAAKLLPYVTHEMSMKLKWSRSRIRNEIQQCALSLSRMINKTSPGLLCMASSGYVTNDLHPGWLWN